MGNDKLEWAEAARIRKLRGRARIEHGKREHEAFIFWLATGEGIRVYQLNSATSHNAIERLCEAGHLRRANNKEIRERGVDYVITPKGAREWARRKRAGQTYWARRAQEERPARPLAARAK